MNTFSGLLNNAALMLILCVIYDTFGVYAIQKKALRDYLTGVLFGLTTIIVMLNPWSLQPGVFFDTRWVLLSLCGLFFGLIPTAIAVIIAGAFRLYQGGPGGTVGTIVIVVTACVGLAWRYWKVKYHKPLGWMQLYVFGVLVQLAMLSCMFLMPAGMRLPIIKTVGPPILTIYPFLTLLIGLILKRHEERRDIEKEIFQRKSEFEAIFKSITDAIVFVDKERKAVMINPSFTKIFGYKIEELLGQTTQIIYANPEEFTKQGEVRYSEEVIINKPVYEIEYRRKDGTVFPAETLGAQVRDSKGQIIGFLGVIRDITPKKEIEKEKAELENKLRQAYKMEAIGTMAGGIAHDFNNILAVILGNADLALNKTAEGSSARNNINQILAASKRAKDLVGQILAFTRQTDKKTEPLNIVQAVDDSLKLLSAVLPSSIEVHKKYELDEGVILIDPTQFHQVMINICTNAAQSMHDKGTLKVGLKEVNLDDKQHGLYIRFSVGDTGAGIAQANIDKIFDPFFTTKEEGHGTGMGLSVVQGIVVNHGGFLTLDTKPGEGSTFHLFFPKIEEQPIEKTTASEILPTGNESILVVDDESALVNMLSNLLEGFGYTVTGLTSSSEALKVFKSRQNDFDLVITDMSMPELTGKELSVELLKIRADIPIILCTGYSSHISKDEAQKLGIREFFMKPLDIRQLATTVRKILDDKV
jgi:PAS domain S-box-containing protein